MSITETNKEIIRLMGEGNTDKEIAEIMQMPVRTIQGRIYKMLGKWKCRNRTQLVLKVVLFNIGQFTVK